ncbi:MAG: GntR family transcriptional regulator, partial [Oscillospiraceae bacterium]
MNIIISNANSQPIYEQIYLQIKSEIISEDLKEGDILPSIRNLAKD